MNMFEEAQAISGMIKMLGASQAQIAKNLGVSQSYIANKLRLLRFSDAIRNKILDTGLCERQARMLLRLDREDDISAAIDVMANRKSNTAESERIIDAMVEAEAPRRISTAGERMLGIERFESYLQKAKESLTLLGVKVEQKTQDCGNKKYITIFIED